MTLKEEIRLKVPPDLIPFLEQRDGAAHLIAQLPQKITPKIASDPTADLQRAWELCGLYFAEKIGSMTLRLFSMACTITCLRTRNRQVNVSTKACLLCGSVSFMLGLDILHSQNAI